MSHQPQLKGTAMTSTEPRKAKPSEVKDFFGTPSKPVTNAELIAFKQTDQQGYDELAFALGAHLDAAP